MLTGLEPVIAAWRTGIPPKYCDKVLQKARKASHSVALRPDTKLRYLARMLVRETGAVLETATAYADAAYAAAFHAERGTIADWQALVEAGAADGALVDATRCSTPPIAGAANA